MSTLILVHLGDSIPQYLRDCVHQVRLWSPKTHINLILSPCQKVEPFFKAISDKYNITLVFTDELNETNEHKYFNENFKGDVDFRKGYWKFVKERFFYIEELISQKGLVDVISMEYDVLIYTNLDILTEKLKCSHRTLRYVRDCDERAHPAFIYIPTCEAIHGFNVFLTSIINEQIDDMDALAQYGTIFNNKAHYLPVITESLNRSVDKRTSIEGGTSEDPWYLSEDSDLFGGLFDSLSVGQWLGDIDPRNLGSIIEDKTYISENTAALYSIKEVKVSWNKLQTDSLWQSGGPWQTDSLWQSGAPWQTDSLWQSGGPWQTDSLWQSGGPWQTDSLWQPFLDSMPLFTIHVHSKALSCFLSDREKMPNADYKPTELLKTLLSN